MRRQHTDTRQEPDPVTKKATELAQIMGERSQMNKELLITLAHAVGRNEKVQHRFRNAVLLRLSRIEATVGLIHGAQLAEAQKWKPGFEDKLDRQAEASEEFIKQKSDELGFKMAKYIYGESEEPILPRGGRRKWSGWEI